MHNYSGTKCPKCDSDKFEMIPDSPARATHKYEYMRCSSCKTFLAALPFTHTNSLIQKIIDHLHIK